ncbi:putative ribonuclease H-like domain-containing protein [Tanacetum coccineum]
MWILGTNLIFAFPLKFWSYFRVPSYFDYRNTTLFQLLDFSIYDFYWFFHKFEFVIELKLFHWNDKGFLASVVEFALSFQWFHGLFLFPYISNNEYGCEMTVMIRDDGYRNSMQRGVRLYLRAKKLEKSHDPLALVAHTGSSSRNTSSYYVTHPTSVVDYEDEYQQDDVHTNSEDPLTSAMLNPGNTGRNTRCAYVQEEVVEGSNAQNETGNVQRTLRTSSSGNTSTVQCYNCSGKGHYARNCPKPRVRDSKYFMEQMLLAKQDEVGVLLTDEQNDFLFADASRMEEIEELSANICLMARIQPADNTSDAGPSYDSAFISEVQSSSIKDNQEQIGSVEKDTHVPDLYTLEQLARNAYKEAEKQQLFAQKVQQQNTTLTSQLELYKERVRVLENIKGDNNYLNEFLEADRQAKHFNQQAQSQFVRDRDIIRDLEKQRDKLDLAVTDYKRKNEELQKTHLILKRQMSENEDRYHDTILDLEAKLKKNVDLILKLGNSLQGMFMLGPKPLSVYDSQLKHGLGYPNPYTLKQAISQCPKLYLASSLSNSEIPLNVRDTEDTLDDASKSQQKMKEKMNDPIAVANKQNCWTIDYKQINALYKDFVPQKELSAEQKYFPSSFIPSDKTPNATSSVPASMPSESPLIIQLDKMKSCFQTLSELIQKNCKRASIFYTSPEEIQLNDFCQDQVKPIVNELQFYFEFFRKLFQRDIKEMKDVFESTESELCEIKKQNDFLKDQLLEASLRHEVEISVLLNHECVDNSLHAEIEQISVQSVFHYYAKSLWAAISIRFQKLISQLEVHAAPVSKEDINQKFLRSLPPSWSQIALIMRNKPDIDQTDIDDLYNNLRNTSSTNEVSTASGNFRVNTAGGTSSTSQVSSTPGADEVVCSFFAQQTMSPLLDNEDLPADCHERMELAWGEKYEFQNYELKCREVKIDNLKMELEKVVKERDELKVKIEKWEESSKGLNKILNSQMSAKDKNGLGYGTQLDEMSNKSETDSEISMSVFEVRSSDEEITPANDRFSKADGYHAVPPPITGNFLTPRADISFAGLDEYAIRKKIIESKTTELNTDTSKSKTSETVGKTNEVNIKKPKSVHESVVPKPKINRDKVIIEDWNSDDEDDVSAVKTVSPVKTNETQTSPEPKLKTVVNTGQRVIKPVWDNAKRVNQQKFSNNLKYPQARRTFVPSGVLTRTGLVNPVRPNGKRAVHTVSTPWLLPRASYSPIKRSYYTKPAFRPKNLKQDVKTSGVKNMTTAGTRAVVNTGKGGNPESILQDHAVVDSGCSSHMTGNKAYLSDYKDYNGGFVAFGSDPKGGKITGKGKIRTANLDFDDVYFVDELKFNIFFVSQMCDKKISVLFTDTECLILSPSFKLLDESQVVLRAPRKNEVYSLDLKNIVPSGGITCLYANATTNESKLWHKRLGHVNFKNINKLVKGHLVRGLPSKVFVNDHTYVACKKGKQHKASCKAKLERTIRKPLELLDMDLFRPVSVESINKKKYCLVVTDDFSRFSWVFFLATKDETNEILYKFITGLENQLNHKVKIIRSDHGTKFKNHAMNEFCAKKGIKREFSVARTPQQNGVAERKK